MVLSTESSSGVSYFSYFLVLGWGVLREKSPLSKAPLLRLGSGAFVWRLFTFFMALFNKHNSAGENPLARRVAQRGGAYVKRGLVDSSPAAVI